MTSTCMYVWHCMIISCQTHNAGGVVETGVGTVEALIDISVTLCVSHSSWTGAIVATYSIIGAGTTISTRTVTRAGIEV